LSALTFDLRPSRRLAATFAVAHGVAVVLLWVMALQLAVQAAGSALLLASAVFYVRRDALLLSAQSIVAVALDEGKIGLLTQRDGRQIEGVLLGSSFVAPYLTVLNFQSEGNFFACNVVILPDSLDAEIFRQLRVWLRWKNP